MANPFAGEVEVLVDGVPHKARLTLGALAELEAQLQEDSLVALVQRFETGAYAARDVLALLVAGLRGGGWQGRADDLLSAEIGAGPLDAARLAARLLALSFGPEDAAA